MMLKDDMGEKRNKRIIFIEPQDNWHFLFNKKIIENTCLAGCQVEYIGQMSKVDLNINAQINTVELKKKLFNVNKYYLIIKNLLGNNEALLLFLSYELVSMPYLLLIRLIFLKNKIYLVEHNTIPIRQDRYMKKFVYRISNLFFEKIVLSVRAQKYLKDEFNKVAHYIPHPIVLKNKKNIKKYIFSPSGSTTDAENELLVKKLGTGERRIYIKSNTYKSDRKDAVVVAEKFPNYNEILEHSFVIFIGNERLEYRESGPLYEALALNKKVLMLKGGIYDELLAKGFDVELLHNFNTNEVHEDHIKYKNFVNEHGDVNFIKSIKKIIQSE
jgi:hypothetical protein